jgi:hypothetical protein
MMTSLEEHIKSKENQRHAASWYWVLTNTNGDMVELSPTFCDNPIRVDLILW